MKNTFIFLFALTLLSVKLHAQESSYMKDPAATQALSAKVCTLFYEGKYSKAFNELRDYWPLPMNEIDALEDKTIKQMNMVSDRIGKPSSVLKIKDEKIGNIALRETYFLCYDKSVIRFKFTYYKNEKGWILHSFKWDDTMSEEFE